MLLFSFDSVAQINQKTKIAITESREHRDLSRIAKHFIGKPYRSNSLSKQNPEVFVCDLNSFDCVTLIENSLALYFSNGNDSLYKNALLHVRYSGDSLRYEKRFHYFSDAMRHLNFPLIGSDDMLQKEPKSFTFLSTYLKNTSASSIDINRIQERENTLRSRAFLFTPSNKLDKLLPLLKSGDILGFVAKKSTIDFLHTAIVYRTKGKVYLLHASQEYKRVVISPNTLDEYLKSHPQFIGVCAFRPIFKE